MIELTPTTLLSGAAFGVIAAFWQQTRNILSRLSNVMVTNVSYQSDVSFQVKLFLKAKWRPFYAGRFIVDSQRLKIKGMSGIVQVPFLLPNHQAFWWRWKGKRLHVIYVHESDVSFLRGSDIKAFTQEALEFGRSLGETKEDRYYVTVCEGNAVEAFMGNRTRLTHRSHHDESAKEDAPPSISSSGSLTVANVGIDEPFMFTRDQYEQNTANPLEHLFYEPKILALIDDARKWLDRGDWYAKRGIPWRRGLLAHGVPGTGKSSFASSMAKSLKIPLYLFRLSTMSDSEFTNYMRGVSTPAVVLFEDFDTVFNHRESCTVHQSLTFDCVLNTLSGVNALDGYYLIITTNDVSKLDSAIAEVKEDDQIASRPGRIDITVEFGIATMQCRRKILEHTLDGLVGNEELEELTDKSAGYTAAQTQELAIKTAFALLN